MDLCVTKTPAWSSSERAYAVQLINEKYDQLYCRFKGSTLGAKEKEAAWEKLVNTLNSSGATQCHRSVRQVKDMYANLKCRAKKKEFEKKTGGGPQIFTNTIEDLVIDGIRNKPQLVGIPEGIETNTQVVSTVKETCTEEDKGSGTTSVTHVCSTSAISECTTPSLTDCDKSEPLAGPSSVDSDMKTTTGKHALWKRDRKRRSDEDCLYTLEKKRAEVEIDLLLQRKQQERELFILKKQQFHDAIEQERNNENRSQKVL